MGWKIVRRWQCKVLCSHRDLPARGELPFQYENVHVKCLYKSCSSPQVVRTRLRQAPLEDGRLKYTALVQCFKLIWKEEGIAGLYGGLVPHMLRAVPNAIVMFGVYEGTLRMFGTTSEI